MLSRAAALLTHEHIHAFSESRSRTQDTSSFLFFDIKVYPKFEREVEVSVSLCKPDTHIQFLASHTYCTPSCTLFIMSPGQIHLRKSRTVLARDWKFKKTFHELFLDVINVGSFRSARGRPSQCCLRCSEEYHTH